MAETTKDQMKKKPKYKLPGRPKKRLFIGMLLLTTVLMACLLYLIWYIGVPGLARVQPLLPLRQHSSVSLTGP